MNTAEIERLKALRSLSQADVDQRAKVRDARRGRYINDHSMGRMS